MDPRQVDPSEIESINSLETARIALRWALERIRLLEQGGARKGGDSVAAAYYRRMDALISDFTHRRLDVGKLLEREAEVEVLEQRLRARRLELEHDGLDRTTRLEEQYQRLRRELETRLRRETEALWKDFSAEYDAWRARVAEQERTSRAAGMALEAQKKAWIEEAVKFDQAAQTERGRSMESLAQFRHATEDLLARRLGDLEAEMKRREEAWRAEEERLRSRDREWHDRQSRLEHDYLSKSAELEDLKAEMLRAMRGKGKEEHPPP
ncbi:MAG: hypothetical protein HY748_01130 [Elusimicrobia bacterium]|nr:hypothetical protein [Elusimicrobiota bacterium]